MKHLYLLTLTLTLTLTLSAQHKYIPFPDSNAIWVVKHYNENGVFYKATHTSYPKDTIINGIAYHKVLQTVDSSLMTRPGSLDNWYAIRNDTALRKVFIYDLIHGGGGVEKVLYDFTLNVGDTIPTTYWDSYRKGVITKVDTIMIDTNKHLVFQVMRNGEQIMPYVEGIGGTAGLIFQPYYFEGGSQLICLMLSEERIPYYTFPGEECKLYPNFLSVKELDKSETKVSIYPHPIQHNSVLKLENSSELLESLEIYNTTGALVLSKYKINKREVEIGDIIPVSGFCIYKLITKSGSNYTGKFLNISY